MLKIFIFGYMRFSTLLIALAMAGLFSSCGMKYVNFTKEERELFDTYSKNDTLIFQNLFNGERDTTIIDEKRIYHDFDPWMHKNIEHCMSVSYTTKRFKYHENDVKTESFLFTCKARPDEIKKKHFSYLRANFYFNENAKVVDKETLSITGKEFTDVYQLVYFAPQFTSSRDFSPHILYWDKKYGIIKYITMSGEVWERVNFSKK